jgi:hypothetical protein
MPNVPYEKPNVTELRAVDDDAARRMRGGVERSDVSDGEGKIGRKKARKEKRAAREASVAGKSGTG